MSDVNGEDARNNLVVPFLDARAEFAYGVEFGMLYARMQWMEETEISGYFTIANQEQITLTANRLGWAIESMEEWRHDPQRPADWFFLRMAKAA